MPYTRSQWEAGTFIQALVLTVDGAVYRYATSTANVSSDNGTLLLRQGLSPFEFEDAIALPGETAPEPGQEVEVLDPLLDLRKVRGRIHGELSILRVGSAWETREVLLSGDAEEQVYGEPGETVTLVLSEAPWRGSPSQFPDSPTVTDASWPRAASSGYQIGEDVRTARYPVVVGAPGFAKPEDTSTAYAAVPALLVEIDTSDLSNTTNPAVVLIGNGVLRCAGVSNSVRLINVTNPDSVTLTPSAVEDDLGQPATIVSVVKEASGGIDIADGDELWCAFLDVDSGGITSPYGSVALRGAGDVLGWMLQQSGARIDFLSFSSARRALNGIRLDFYLNELADPLSLAIDDLVPILPVMLHVGTRGLEFIPLPIDATYRDAVDHLDLDHLAADFDDDIRRTPTSDLVTTQTLEYAPHGPESRYQGRLAYAPADRFGASDRVQSIWAAALRTRLDHPQDGAAITSDLIVDSKAAARVLDWMLKWYGQPRETARVLLPQGYADLKCGDVVAVTRSARQWDKRLAIVRSRTRALGPVRLELVTLPDWVRDGRDG
jgi:hypothetical protein